MSLWNNNIGFPMQTGNPGISIKPIDIRPFLDDNSGSGRSLIGRSSSTSKAEKEDALPKGRTNVVSQLTYQKQAIESQMQTLGQSYEDKILSALEGKSKDGKTPQQLQNDYSRDMNQLFQMKQELSLAENDETNIQFSNYNQAQSQITGKQIGNEVAFNSGANVTSGNDLLTYSPVQIFKGKLVSYNDWMQIENNNATIGKNGRPTPFAMPNTNMSNSQDFSKEINSELAKSGSIESLKVIDSTGVLKNPDIIGMLLNDSTFIEHTETTDSDNIKLIAGNIWNSISQDSRNYALSQTLKSFVAIPSGKQEATSEKYENDVKDNNGKVIHKKGEPIMQEIYDYYNGTAIIAEIEKNKLLANKAKENNDIDGEKKYIDKAKKLADGIINMAQLNTIQTAMNKSIGMENYSFTNKEVTPSGESGETKGKDGLLATPMKLAFDGLDVNPKNGIFWSEDPKGEQKLRIGLPYGIGTYPQSIMEQKAPLWKTYADDKVLIGSLSDMVIIGDVAVKSSSLLGYGQEADDTRIKRLDGRIMIGPKYDTTKDKNGILFRTLSDGKMKLQQKYQAVRIIVDEDYKVPHTSSNGISKEMSIQDMYKDKERFGSLDIQSEGGKGWNDDYSFVLYVPVDDKDVYGLNSKDNKASAQNAAASNEINMTQEELVRSRYQTAKDVQTARAEAFKTKPVTHTEYIKKGVLKEYTGFTTKEIKNIEQQNKTTINRMNISQDEKRKLIEEENKKRDIMFNDANQLMYQQ